MKINILVLILTGLMVFASAVPGITGQEKRLTVIYTNNIGGEIEPCG